MAYALESWRTVATMTKLPSSPNLPGGGDQAALSRFVEATQRDVWRTVAYLADPASADDLTQETFLRAIKSLPPRFSGRSTARTWLLSIARRVVVDQIRYNTSRPRPAHVVDLDDVLGGLGGGSRIENMVEIRILLDGLEPERREAWCSPRYSG